eukprot:Skav202132  [mRNA]  locus=scaffold929:4699:9148:+ [translate_table: standard]
MAALSAKYEASPSQPETPAPAVSSAEEAQALRASLAALSDEMTTSRGEWSKLQEEVKDFPSRQANELTKQLAENLQEPIEKADACDKLGWRDATSDLVRMVEHTWVRYRIPEKAPGGTAAERLEASILKLLRQKVDIETVQGLQALIEEPFPERPGLGARMGSHGEASHLLMVGDVDCVVDRFSRIILVVRWIGLFVDCVVS